MPRWICSAPLPSGDGSPSTTLRMSATSSGSAQVAAPVDAGVVEVLGVGAADEVAHRRDRAIGDDAHRPPGSDRTEVARLAAEVRLDLRRRGEAEAAIEAGQLAGLDFVERVVAANEQQPDHRLGRLALVILAVGREDERLHGPCQRQAEQRGDVLARGLARSRRLREVGRRRRARRGRRDRLGELDVGGVVGAGAVDDRVLAGGGDHLELVRANAADRAVVGGDGAKDQAHALEDAHVGGVHPVVAEARRVEIAIERIGVLHRELAPAHDAEARPPLVAELGLDVIEISRQRAVAAQLLASDVGDDLFARRLDHEVALVAVLDAHQLGAVLLEPPRFLPQLGRLHHRHQQLDAAGAVHLLAHDALDPADDAQAHRHVRVDAGGESLDEAGAHHELVAHDLGIGGGFLQRRDEELTGFHRRGVAR